MASFEFTFEREEQPIPDWQQLVENAKNVFNQTESDVAIDWQDESGVDYEMSRNDTNEKFRLVSGQQDYDDYRLNYDVRFDDKGLLYDEITAPMHGSLEQRELNLRHNIGSTLRNAPGTESYERWRERAVDDVWQATYELIARRKNAEMPSQPSAQSGIDETLRYIDDKAAIVDEFRFTPVQVVDTDLGQLYPGSTSRQVEVLRFAMQPETLNTPTMAMPMYVLRREQINRYGMMLGADEYSMRLVDDTHVSIYETGKERVPSDKAHHIQQMAQRLQTMLHTVQTGQNKLESE